MISAPLLQVNLQRDLDYQPPLIQKKENLRYKLSLCGRISTINVYCKKEEHQGDRLIKTVRSPFFCEIRYCSHPGCLIQRFKRQLQTFEDIERFHGLHKLWHFTIGFESVPESEFKKNASNIFKRQQYVLNRFFEKLRQKGLEIQAVRVLDYSFKTPGMVYLHYHFGAIPIGQKRIRSSLILIHQVRKEMVRNMKIQTPFHFEDFGLGSKKGVLSYLAIRASGMYKYDMTKNPNYKHVQSNLRASIENKKYIFLNQILTEKEYLKSFYNKSHFVTIGGLPRPRHGSNITDIIPSKCPCCGPIERKDVRVEIIFDMEVARPPDLMKTYPELVVKVVKI